MWQSQMNENLQQRDFLPFHSRVQLCNWAQNIHVEHAGADWDLFNTANNKRQPTGPGSPQT